MGFRKFDTLKGVANFHRYLCWYGVWFNPELRLSTEGLYVVSYDREDLEQKRFEEEWVVPVENNRMELEEDLFM